MRARAGTVTHSNLSRSSHRLIASRTSATTSWQRGANSSRNASASGRHLLQRLRTWLWANPDEFFLPGIAILTLAIITGISVASSPLATRLPGLILLAMILFLLPSSQCAIQIMDGIITQLLPAEILPKLDFSKGIPADCVTLVAVPTLLLNEKQVHTPGGGSRGTLPRQSRSEHSLCAALGSGRFRSSRQRRQSVDRAVLLR